MADVEQNSSKKKLSELRVIDLRCELEKRGLDKTGVKTALLERLTKALQDEGKDPEEHVFEVAVEKTPSKVPLKRSSRKAKEGDSEVANEEEEEEEEKQEEEENKESAKTGSKDAENAVEKKKSSDLEEQKNAQCNGSDCEDGTMSPPKPENAPVVAPLTVEDVINLDTSTKLKASDNDSLIVNPDDTQSDIDSSVNERDSVCEESMLEEAGNNSSNAETPNKNTEDGDTSVEKADVQKEETTKQDSNVKTNDKSETPDKGKEAKTATDSTKGKSPSEKIEISEKAPGGKRAILLISNDSVKRVAASSKNLWVSGLAEKTRANDLKALFSKFGKVSGAKIVTNARTPGTRCYGFITMATSEEAALCIEKLNHTELHGRMITVEKTTREPTGTIKRADLKAIQTKVTQKKSEKSQSISKTVIDAIAKSLETTDSPKAEKPKTDKPKSTEKRTDKSKLDKKAENVTKDEKSKDDTEVAKEEVSGAEGKKERKRTPSKEREGRSRDRSRDRRRYRSRRTRSRERISFRGGFFNRGFRRGFGYRPFMNRSSFLDRHPRERSRSRESPRRRFSDLRQREIERKNKEESMRLERERERLRIEREKLERERAEVLRLEREKQRLERERLEREKAELRKRTAITLDDRRGLKRGFEGSKELDTFWDDRKRRREPSLEPSDGFRDFGRDRGAFSDRRSDRFESRAKGGDISPTFNAPGRREGRHDHDSFHGRSRNSRDAPERGREDWKGKPGRDRNFDRGSRSNFNERGGRNFDRPHPWESGVPERDQKFDNPPNIGNSQWAPVNKTPENWGRIEPPPPERWGALEHPRSQPGINIGHPPNIGPPNPMVFGGTPGNDIIPPMGGHFPVDRFNSNMMRRF